MEGSFITGEENKNTQVSWWLLAAVHTHNTPQASTPLNMRQYTLILSTTNYVQCTTPQGSSWLGQWTAFTWGGMHQRTLVGKQRPSASRGLPWEEAATQNTDFMTCFFSVTTRSHSILDQWLSRSVPQKGELLLPLWVSTVTGSSNARLQLLKA